MNWDDFQQKAIVAIPKQTLKPNRCWIGVLHHEKPPESSLEERDFIWMIGHESDLTCGLAVILSYSGRRAHCAEQSVVGVIKESASPTLARQDPKSLEARSNVSPMTLPTDGAKTTEPRSVGLALHRPQLNSPFPIANKLFPSPSPIDRNLSSIPKDTPPQREANIDAIAIPDGAKIERCSPRPFLDQPALRSPVTSLVQPDQDNIVNRERSSDTYGSAICTDRHIRAILNQQDPEPLRYSLVKMTTPPIHLFSHGSTMMLGEVSRSADYWKACGDEANHHGFKGVIMMGAHWDARGTNRINVSMNPKPAKSPVAYVHPRKYVDYELNPDLETGKKRIQALKEGGLDVRPNESFDWIHDTYLILIRMFPERCPPTKIIGMNSHFDPHLHARVGQILAPFRDQGYLIIGTGGAVHNLYRNHWGQMLKYSDNLAQPYPPEAPMLEFRQSVEDVFVRNCRDGVKKGALTRGITR
ncbi:Aromatic ring-opening dioxygenase family protein [Pyrenophora tritici-repentis]|nr:Aromatic ring-opening dioxygenase family protein [Pyrenophora tritici-repentis]